MQRWWRYALMVLYAGALWAQQERTAQLQRAAVLESVGDYEGAARLYRELCQRMLDSACVHGLSRNLVKLGRAAEALPVVEQYVQHSPSPLFTALLGELYWRTGRRAEALRAWQQGLQSRHPDAYRAVARSQYELQLVEEALQTLQEGRSRLGNDTLFADEFSAWAVRVGKLELGVESTLQWGRTHRDFAALQARLLLYLAFPGAVERVRTILQRWSRQYRSDTLVQYVWVWFLEEQGEDAQALQAVRELDRRLGAGGMELLAFAERMYRAERLETARQAYEELLQMGELARELRLKALYGYIQTLQQLPQPGAMDPALRRRIQRLYQELLAQSERLPITAEVLYSFARFLNDVAGDAVAAQSALERLMRDFRHTPWAMAAMVERAKMALRQGQMEQAESLLRAVIWQGDSIAPDWALWARYWLAELEFYRGRLDSAQAHYSVLALRPESPVANDALQRLQVFEQARTVSEELLKRFGRAEFFAFQREYARAQVEFLAVAEAAGDHPLAEFALIRAAESAIAHGKLEEAQQIVNRYLANYDDVLYGDRALLLLGQIAEQQQRFPEALQLYQQLLLRYPGSIYTRQVQERIQSLRQRPS